MIQKITICIVTFNSIKYLPDLLDSILNSSLKDIFLLFIDNNSTDGTVNYLNDFQIQKSIIKLPKNMGHSFAVNVALESCKTRYLILLDHDTTVHEDLFKNLYSEAIRNQSSEYAVFVPKIIDRSRNEIFYGGQLHYIGKMCKNRKKPKSLELGIAGTTALLLDLVKIPQNLKFDNVFFIFWNDIDFFYRLRLIGIKIRLVPTAVVFHLEGSHNFSHRRGIKYSPTRAFYIIRNHRLFIIKNYSFITILVFLPCFLIYELFNIVFCIKKHIFIKGYLYSILSTIKLLPIIMKKRFVVQRRKLIREKNLVGWCELDYNPGVVATETERQFKLILDQFLMFYFFMVKNTIWF